MMIVFVHSLAAEGITVGKRERSSRRTQLMDTIKVGKGYETTNRLVTDRIAWRPNHGNIFCKT